VSADISRGWKSYTEDLLMSFKQSHHLSICF